MNKYKKSLGMMIIMFAIILLSSMLLLAVHLNVSPILGVIATFAVILIVIIFTPERFMIRGNIREVRK